jgi:hypothetical protein
MKIKVTITLNLRSEVEEKIKEIEEFIQSRVWQSSEEQYYITQTNEELEALAYELLEVNRFDAVQTMIENLTDEQLEPCTKVRLGTIISRIQILEK